MEINPARLTGVGMGTPNQNLINPTSYSGGVRPAGYWKSIVLDLLSMLSAAAVGYTYFFYLVGGLSPWYLLSAFLAFSTCSALQVFLTSKMLRRMFVIFGEAVVISIWFVFYTGWQAAAIGAGVLFLVLLWGYFGSHSDLKNSVDIRFFGITRGVLGKVVTALLLFMIIVYAPQAEGQRAFIPRASFRSFFAWMTGYANNFYPAVELKGTFKAFGESLAKAQFKANPNFASLSPAAQSAAVAEAVQQLSNEVKAATGVAPAADEALGDVAYNYIVSLLNDWRGRFGGQFIFAWGLAIFLALRTIGVAFVWITQIVALLFYELLLALNFMHIGESVQTQEVVQY